MKGGKNSSKLPNKRNPLSKSEPLLLRNPLTISEPQLLRNPYDLNVI